ncbi:MAG: GDP-mannose 4,6-dehydratase [Actinobacteria bacterium]|nr:GDP-mannose 4,6-dehydratase [Actinomycetota bacterium]
MTNDGVERKKALVTGADGFVASHLLGVLASETEWDLHGIGLKDGLSEKIPGVSYRVVDITDYDLLSDYIRSLTPDVVFHLAAQPSVALSWKNPRRTYEINLLGQLNLLEAIHESCNDISVLITCSSEEYGKVTPDMVPIKENTELKPCSHYAVSKVSQEMMGLMYEQALGWRVMVTRGFNQAGPGQSPDFAVSSFARQIALIEAEKIPPVLKVGNLDASRDFIDVRDTARAFFMIMENGRGGSVYNVCSGVARKISEILDMLLGMTRSEITVEHDSCRQRPSDIPVLEGDGSRLREEVGWKPSIPVEQTLRDTLDYWRGQIL